MAVKRKTPAKIPDSVREYMRALGARGGSAKGLSKVRGTREHYRSMALARWNKQSKP